MPTAEVRLEQLASLQKELEELTTAMALEDLDEIVDGAVDMIYVLIGICLKFGFDPTYVMAEVQRSNMDKNPAGEGSIGRRTADGKSMKPDGWVGPRIHELGHALMGDYAPCKGECKE